MELILGFCLLDIGKKQCNLVKKYTSSQRIDLFENVVYEMVAILSQA